LATGDAERTASADDIAWMRNAFVLAARGLGCVWPNPAVGCILVKDGRAVGRGWTQPGGRPHAETEALRRAGGAAAGSTAYVTLEPCDHQGQTTPCSLALLEAGVARVVAAVADPDPRVGGQGLERLRAAGIIVTTGVCAEAATELNLGFFLRIHRRRPMITVKLATSLDGRIATSRGDSRWITGEDARAEAHRLRASHDAVLIGSGTAIADDPELTCRLPGLSRRSPVRVIADSRLRLPLSAQAVQTARQHPTWILTSRQADAVRRRLLLDAGVEVLEVTTDAADRLDPPSMAAALAERGITRVLLEGGGELAAAFLAAGLVDRLAWFHAPKVIGGDGVPAAASLRVASVASAPTFEFRALRALNEDVLARYVRPL
jgi:diaminohydroxyphosphoribosylaminopyrimidine deaminase / 5-amino-6-(5-phosphoribosylamino)uracil reductase